MMQRIITALVLAPVAIGLTLWAPAWLFAALLFLLICAALAEWNSLELKSIPALGVAALVLGALAITFYRNPEKAAYVILAGALFWAYQAWDLKARGVAPRLAPLTGFARGAFVLFAAWVALR